MNTRPFSSFGELLKAFRKRRHLTQKALATRIGVHTNTISIWERGNYLPESKTLVLEAASQLRLNEQETRQFLEASLTALSPYWLLPFPRNPFFTGRTGILEEVDALLHASPAVALTQSYALHGLGGIGKTQLAVEYAYQHALDYTAIFWIAAETVESILASFLAIAELLSLAEREEANQQRIVAAVQYWLTIHKGWLLIWDNLEDLELLQRFHPSNRHGATIITTRRQAVGTLAQGIQLQTMMQEEGMLLLLRRSKVLAPQARSEEMKQLAERFPADYAAAQVLVTIMEGLPLALDQAGAYIEETGCSVSDYLQCYTNRRDQLLGRRGMPVGGHPESVTATFKLICQRLERDHPQAADVLHLCALLYAEAIPEELFTTRTSHQSAVIEPMATDSSELDVAIATLRTFSLVQRHSETHTLSIHRLVQTILQEEMSEAERRQWQQRAILILNALFPEVVPEAWTQCERYLPHVLTCAASIPDQANEQELAEVLCKAADYLRERAQYEQAGALYQRARRILEQALEPEHPLMASLLNGLAKLAYGQGKYEQAEAQFQQARRILEHQFGPEHPEVALALNNLAILYSEQGKYEQAEVQFQQARRILEHLLGPEHPRVAIALNNLAILSTVQGKYEEAETFYQRALTIWERHLGQHHPETARSLMGLANLYSEQGKYEQAEAMYQQARHICEEALGFEHPLLATALNNLADLYLEQGKYGEAEPLFRRARHIWEETLGPEHPQVASVLNGLGGLYRQQEKYEEAEALYWRALTIREQHLGPQHPETARSLAGLGLLYEKQGNDEQAELFLQRACTIFEQRLGLAHREAVKTRNDYQSLLEQRRGASVALIEKQQGPEPQTSSGEFHHPLMPELRVKVRGRSKQVAYTRTVRMREVTITCEVCARTVTQVHYPSGRIKYCSAECRDARRAQMYEERVRKQREKRQAEREADKQARQQEV